MSRIDHLGRVRNEHDDVRVAAAETASQPKAKKAKRPRRDSQQLALRTPPPAAEWIRTLEAEVLRAAANLHDAEAAHDASEKARKEAADAVRWAKVSLKAASTELASAKKAAAP
jgi:hypothetical protein